MNSYLVTNEALLSFAIAVDVEHDFWYLISAFLWASKRSIIFTFQLRTIAGKKTTQIVICLYSPVTG